MFFSVIIPVYNVLPYLREAVDSVLKQDFKGEFEVILVDDGSTDGSGVVCDEYAKQEVSKNIKIKVIHKPNGGLSSARNAGLGVARGEYIVFLDSDDWIASNAMLTLYTVLIKSKPDILTFPLEKIKLNGESAIAYKSNCLFNVKISNIDFLRDTKIPAACCSAVYRREFICREKLRFREGVYHEDVLFNAQSFCLADTIVALDVSLYKYRQHKNSIICKRDVLHLEKRLQDMRVIMGELVLFRDKYSETDIRFNAVQQMLVDLGMSAFRILLQEPVSFQEKCNLLVFLRQAKLYPYKSYSSNVRFRFYQLLFRMRLPLISIFLCYKCFPFEHPLWNCITVGVRAVKRLLGRF